MITQSGPPLPVFDPTLFGNTSWAHQTVPESSTFIAGTDNNTSTTGHSAGTLFNRAPSASLGLTVTQHVLQGFSLAVNQRQIQIANTNREPSDLTFKL